MISKPKEYNTQLEYLVVTQQGNHSQGKLFVRPCTLLFDFIYSEPDYFSMRLDPHGGLK